jgi:FixJ family two-component response regulator
MSKSQPLIVIVDDEESVANALCRLLRSAGLNAETFTSGREFLKSLPDHTPDCVLLDLHMPHVDGFEVQSQLSQMGSRAPVIVMTGWDVPETRLRATAGGFAAYLRKPVDGQALLDAIARAIAGVDGTSQPPGSP